MSISGLPRLGTPPRTRMPSLSDRTNSSDAAATERAVRPAQSGARPLRVVLVISNLEYGGAQRQVVDLANSVDPSRLDVHICSLSEYVPLADRLKDRQRRLHVIRKSLK